MNASESSQRTIRDFIVCATLERVKDVFDFIQLWGPPLSGQQGRCLRDVLTSYPRTLGDRRHPQETYFSHIIIRIPQLAYDDDELFYGGSRRAHLIADLTDKYQSELTSYLPENATIRYYVEADPDLPADRVQFLFGWGIYLPDDQEVPMCRVHWTEGGVTREIGAIYSAQLHTLLNGQLTTSTLALPQWPFEADRALWLRHRRLAPTSRRGMQPMIPALSIASTTLEVCAIPDGCFTIQMESTHSVIASDRQGHGLIIRAQPLTQPDRDDLVIEPVALHDRTWIPQVVRPRTVRDRMVTLRIVGIALQRLSRYAKNEPCDWRLGMDHDGRLLSSQRMQDDQNDQIWLHLDQTDQLTGEVGGRLAKTLIFPSHWQPHPKLTLELCAVPPVLHNAYCGWLRLPFPTLLQAPVGEWFWLGRDMDSTAQEFHIPLTLLNKNCCFLIWRSHPHGQANQLGLSRWHLKLRFDGQWQVVCPNTTQLPAYHLKTPDQAIDLGTVTPLQKGDLLILGSYVVELGEPMAAAQPADTSVTPTSPVRLRTLHSLPCPPD